MSTLPPQASNGNTATPAYIVDIKDLQRNIPAELKKLPQWVVSGPDKIPKCVHSPQQNASVIDSAHWATFEDAIAAISNPSNNLLSIGFVFTADDPYVFLDLDDKEANPATEYERSLYRHLLTSLTKGYREYSLSGRGHHIIVSAPEFKKRFIGGNRVGRLELYWKERYCFFTGRPMGLEAPEPGLGPYDAEIFTLAREMGLERPMPSPAQLNAHPESETDEEIVAALLKESRRFQALYNNTWRMEGYLLEYPSQSEADMAFFSLLALKTRNILQMERIYWGAPISTYIKANGLARTNHYARRTALAAVRNDFRADIDILPMAFEATAKAFASNSPPTSLVVPSVGYQANGIGEEEDDEEEDEGLPPWKEPLLGDALAVPEGVFAHVLNRVEETAYQSTQLGVLMSSISFFTGLTSRTYSDSNLNRPFYGIYLAPTGTGKDSVTGALEVLFNNAADTLQDPNYINLLGPTRISSAAALAKSLVAQPCQTSVISEAADLLAPLADTKDKNGQTLKRALLEIYSKLIGTRSMAQSYADSTKNIPPVNTPAFSFYAHGTPDHCLQYFTQEMVEDGLLPRLHVMITPKEGVDRFLRKGRPATANELERDHPAIQAIAKVTQMVLQNNAPSGIVPAALATELDEDAAQILSAYKAYCAGRVKSDHQQADLWSRNGTKASRVAGTLAIFDNPYAPVITGPQMKWACDFIEYGTQQVVAAFRLGRVDTSTVKPGDVRMAIEETLNKYWGLSKRQRKSYGISEECFRRRIIQHSALYRLLQNNSRLRKLGFRDNLKALMKDELAALLDDGKLFVYELKIEGRQKAGTVYSTQPLDEPQ